MGTRKRRTSCGQPQATAIFPAQTRAASSSSTSMTANPPRTSFASANGPSVNTGAPVEASTLNTGAPLSRPPVKIRTPAAFSRVVSPLDHETAARITSTSRFSTSGLHLGSANDTGHMSPSSRCAASWNSKVEYRMLNLPEFLKATTTLPSSLA